jgi:hypothetical protein
VALFGLYGASNVTIENNTATSSVAPTVYLGADINIFPYGKYGLKGSGKGDGNSTLNYYFPSAMFSNNVVFGAVVNPANYPSGNFFPSTVPLVGWVDTVNGIWKLLPTSTYKALPPAQDPGVSFDALIAATSTVLTGR